MKKKILLVDDDETIRESLGSVLMGEGYDVETASSGKEAIDKAARDFFPLLVTDLRLPDIDGVELYQNIKKKHPETIAVIITGHATLQSTVKAIKLGAYDYLEKPFKMEEILLTVKRALDHAELLSQNIYLKQELKEKYQPENIIGNHPKMLEIFDLIRKVARTDVTALIRGESGTGKELVAHAIHYMSKRKDRKFVALSCGALPETLLESELFGYEKGAFTGAVSRKPGLFEVADGGTVFLDEIGDLSLATQVKLLRVLQEKEFQPVGGVEQVKVDIRLLSATNKDLEQDINDGKFREDLYYRLNVIQIELPPLREKKDDIPLLVKNSLKKFGSHQVVSKEVMDLLANYHWPGNVRELENVIERAIVLSRGEFTSPDKRDVIALEHLPERLKVGEGDVAVPFMEPIPGKDQAPESLDFKKTRDEFEKQFLQKVINICGGNISEAARKSGISRRHLYEKINKYGIQNAQK